MNLVANDRPSPNPAATAPVNTQNIALQRFSVSVACSYPIAHGARPGRLVVQPEWLRAVAGALIAVWRPVGYRACVVLLPCVMILLQGCVVLPIPTQEHKVLAGKPVTPDQLAFLKPGVTTQSEVIKRLGGPDAIWEDARLYVYEWTMRQGILIWAVVGGYTGTGGVENIEKRHMLLIQFDERDRACRFEQVVRPAFKPYGKFLKEWLVNSKPTQPQATTNGRE